MLIFKLKKMGKLRTFDRVKVKPTTEVLLGASIRKKQAADEYAKEKRTYAFPVYQTVDGKRKLKGYAIAK